MRLVTVHSCASAYPAESRLYRQWLWEPGLLRLTAATEQLQEGTSSMLLLAGMHPCDPSWLPYRLFAPERLRIPAQMQHADLEPWTLLHTKFNVAQRLCEFTRHVYGREDAWEDMTLSSQDFYVAAAGEGLHLWRASPNEPLILAYACFRCPVGQPFAPSWLDGQGSPRKVERAGWQQIGGRWQCPTCSGRVPRAQGHGPR